MAPLSRFALVGLLLGGLMVPPACTEGDDASPAPTPKPTFVPSIDRRLPSTPNARGLLERRGIIHAHTPYSHDACDGQPRDPATDAINAKCLDDFRRGVCQTQHDFVMLTEHDESFSRTEFRDLLLFDAARGDRLIERDGKPVASWMACPDAPPALLLAGTENRTMPLGLEDHVAETQEERTAVYKATTAEALEKLRAAGAVTVLPHTENWTADELASLPIDGFEMFNLHANTILGAPGVLQLASKRDEPELLPHPDLVVVPILNEDRRYVDTWGSVLSRGVRRVGTMGTDCHQNTFASELADGERMDSYRRMMIWFSNHLLVRPGEGGAFDDRSLKEALKDGRLFGVFEVFGHPVGFDFRVESSAGVGEIGAEVTLADAPELVVAAPEIAGLTVDDEQPVRTTRLLRAREGGWDVVAESAGEIRHAVTAAGAYRAEVRLRPRHLAAWLSSFADRAEGDFVWIYANAIYVR